MKKILVSIFLLVFGLCLVGCENIGNNKLLRNQAGYEWLDDINIENIEKVQIEFGGGMTYIGNTRSIYSSIETEVIKDVFDYWYNCKVKQYSKDNEGVMDAGSEHTKFYLKTGEVKEITIIGMYLKDSNGTDLKVKDSYMINESKFLRTHKFVTDEEYGKLYEYTPIMEYAYIGDVPMKEIEFMEMMDEIYLGDEVSQYYIETNFGKIHFLLDVYFWVERTNVLSENEIPIYYQLYNTSIYDLAEKYSNTNKSETYELTIQNDSSNELIGIKEEYKAGEEVEVKMEYDMAVETYVFLNGELLGTLNGSNSLKFNMPEKDSTLVLTYTNAEIYKVNVIDNFDLLIVPLKEYYNAGDTVQVITKFLSGPRVDVQVDGQFLEIKELEAFGYYGYEFIMPEKDVEIAILYNGLMNKPCENNEHQWDEGVVDPSSSLSNPPIKYTCLLCGTTKKEPTEWLEHSHDYIDGLCDCGKFDNQWIIENFRVSDEQILFDGSVDDEFNCDVILLTLKHTTTYIELSKRHFGIDEITEVVYISATPPSHFYEPGNEDKLDNFNQIVFLYVDVDTKQEIIDLIKKIEILPFVESAGPNYIEHGD